MKIFIRPIIKNYIVGFFICVLFTTLVAEETTSSTTPAPTPTSSEATPSTSTSTPATSSETTSPSPTPTPATSSDASAASSPETKKEEESIEEKYKKEFSEITEAVDKVGKLENEVQKSFTDFGDKLTKARELVVAMKKTSFDILKEEKEEKVREGFAKMEEQLKELKEIQTFSEGDFAKVNNEKVTEITTLSTKIEGLLKQLETLVKVDEKTSAAVQLSESKKEESKKDAVKPSEEKALKTVSVVVEQPSVVARAWGMLSDTVVYGITIVNNALDWVISLVRPHEKKKVKKRNVDLSISVSDIPKKANETFVKADRIADALETAHFERVQKFDEATDKLASITQTITTMPALYKHINEQKVLHEASGPAWKKAIVQTFSKVLDLGIAVADVLVYWVHSVYSYTLEPVITKFRKDVSKKMS